MNKKLFLICISFIAISSCKRRKTEPYATKTPVVFTQTTYKYLGSYDANGKPNYLEADRDVVSDNLLSFLAQTLPKGVDVRNTRPDLIASTKSPNLDITERNKVYITFVKEGADYNNALAFYTYPTNNPPVTTAQIPVITFIFPNAKEAGHPGGGLTPGDKVLLGSFEPGTSIGFVLLSNGWNAKNGSVTTGVPNYCSADILNPENDPSIKRHVVILDAPDGSQVVSFEDGDRTLAIPAFHDFSDVFFYITKKKIE